METETEALFRYRTPNREKLCAYGFSGPGETLRKEFPIMQGQFRLCVTVEGENVPLCKVFDNDFGEEYALFRTAATGGFVGEMRTECFRILAKIAEDCYDPEILCAEQTKRVLAEISVKYGAQPEFLWEKTPDCAAIRRTDNGKWFAVLMTMDRSKLDPAAHGTVEVMNLKVAPGTAEMLWARDGIYPAYHMNKKHWITVALDGSVPDEDLFSLLAFSYESVRGDALKKFP